MNPDLDDSIMGERPGKVGQFDLSSLGELLNVDWADAPGRINAGIKAVDVYDRLSKALQIVIPVGGQFLLNAGEVNGWGSNGFVDDNNIQDLGNIGAAMNRTSGGISFPFDVKLKRFFAWHINSNAEALAWGWVVFHQSKTGGSNVTTTNWLLDEVTDNAGVGPRDYANNWNQNTDIDLSATATIPAGNVVGLGVAAPTSTGTRYVQVMSGYLAFEPVIV